MTTQETPEPAVTTDQVRDALNSAVDDILEAPLVNAANPSDASKPPSTCSSTPPCTT